MSVTLHPIGVVRTTSTAIPRHWSISTVEGALVIDDTYVDGLRDIRPGQRIVVLFHFDRSPAFTPGDLVQTSGSSGQKMGVFSICSPVRPNPIGLSILDVTGVDGANLHVRGLDMLDGTPILDIKPHIEVGDA